MAYLSDSSLSILQLVYKNIQVPICDYYNFPKFSRFLKGFDAITINYYFKKIQNWPPIKNQFTYPYNI